jgi:hypothetical protein
MDEATQLSSFSMADRCTACPCPRIERTSASAGRTSASTLRRRYKRLILRALAWSKDKFESDAEAEMAQSCLQRMSMYARICHQMNTHAHWSITRTLTRPPKG